MDPDKLQEIVSNIQRMAREAADDPLLDSYIDEYLSDQGLTIEQLDRYVTGAEPLPPVQETPSAAPEDDGGDWSRRLGLGARSLIQGLSSIATMVPDAGLLAYNLTGKLTGAPEAPYLGRKVSEALTAAGLPEPETTGERFATNALSAVTGAATPAGIAKLGGRAATRFLGGMAANPATQAAAAGTTSLTMDAANQAGVDPRLSLLMGLGTGTAASGVGNRVANAIRGNYTNPQAAQFFDDAAEAGVRVRPGDVPGAPRMIRRIEDTIEEGPGRGAERFIQGQADDLERAATNLQNELRPDGITSVSDANLAVVEDLQQQYRTAKESVSPLFKEAEELSRNAPDALLPGAREQAHATLRELQGIEDAAQAVRAAEYVLDAADGPLSYTQVRALSRNLATRRNAIPHDNEVATSFIDRLYAAVNEDLGTWADNAGDAGTAHRTAMQAFQERVLPFRRDRMVYRAARANDARTGADRLLRGVMGRENTLRSEDFLDLLGDRGRQAAAWSVFGRAAERNVGNSDRSSSFLRSSLMRELNLGSEQFPTPQRRVFEASGAMDRVQRFRDLANALDRANGGRRDAFTGGRLTPFVGVGGFTGAGFAAGGLPGAIAAGASALPINNAITGALYNRPLARLIAAEGPISLYGPGMGAYNRR